MASDDQSEEVVPVLTPTVLGRSEQPEAPAPSPSEPVARFRFVKHWKIIVPLLSIVVCAFLLGPGLFNGFGIPSGSHLLAGNSSGFELNLDHDIVEATWSSFIMILATEMGDETFIIAAVMSMRHNKLTVLAGALSALYFMTVLSAGLGLVLPNLISEQTVRSFATGLYIFFGFRLMWIGARGEEEDKEEEFEDVEKTIEGTDARAETSFVRQIGRKVCSAIFLEALLLTFCAEWGDRSQIATITLASHQNPLGTIVGACIGHTICTSLAVFSGEWLGKRISQKLVAFAGGALFLIFAFMNQVYGI